MDNMTIQLSMTVISFLHFPPSIPSLPLTRFHPFLPFVYLSRQLDPDPGFTATGRPVYQDTDQRNGTSDTFQARRGQPTKCY